MTVSTGSGVTPSDVADIADAVWDEPLSGHSTAGTTGEALDDAATASEVWSYSVSGKVASERLRDADDNAEVTQAKVDQL